MGSIHRDYSNADSSNSSASSEVCCGRNNRNDNFSPLERHNSQIRIEKGGHVDTFIMSIFCIVFATLTIVILVGDIWFLPTDRLQWCTAAILQAQGVQIVEKEYANIDAIRDPCYYHRTMYLLGFSPFECDFGRRMICSVVLGAAIGWERKAADRPAGIRTMSLVSLGSATFTMGGQFAFRSSTMGWDAARVSAAIPSGVGFLGSALIWKEATGPKGPNQRNHVHGIATAASVWLSASIGIGVGGALYVMSIWTVVLVLFVLRLVPELILEDGYRRDSVTDGLDDDDDDNDDIDDDDKDNDNSNLNMDGMPMEIRTYEGKEYQQQLMMSSNSPTSSPTEGEIRATLSRTSLSTAVDAENAFAAIATEAATTGSSSQQNSLRHRVSRHLQSSRRKSTSNLQKMQTPSFHSD